MVTDDMVALVPQLHSFARSLTRDGVRADDLVQEALMRALSNIDRFRPGTNLKAWLFTIVRNEHYSQLRRRKFEAHGIEPDLLPEPSVPPDHDGKLELRDLDRALASLSPGQRTALILVSVSGFSYEEAATICACAVGTIKSRVARARETLMQMLEGHLPISQVAQDDELGSFDEIRPQAVPMRRSSPTRRVSQNGRRSQGHRPLHTLAPSQVSVGRFSSNPPPAQAVG